MDSFFYEIILDIFCGNKKRKEEKKKKRAQNLKRVCKKAISH